MSVTTGNDAVEQIVMLLNNTQLTDFSGRAYYYEKPEKVCGEYIVVNHLPFVRREATEEGTINVNIHVPRKKTNEPDSKRLSQLAHEIIALFPAKGLYLGGMYFEFNADSRPVEENDGTYFTNLQILVTYNNLNYN